MKNILRLTAMLIIAASLCLVLVACGSGKTDANGFTYKLDKETNTYTVTGYTGSAAEIEIPATYESLPVTAIASSAFKGNTTITKVTFPASLKTIGDNAFNACAALAKVEFKKTEDGKTSLTDIMTGAFANCVKLDNVVLPDSLTNIGYKAFKSCTAMKKITFPKDLKSVDYYAFSDCVSLNTVELNGANNFDVYGNAFFACADLKTLMTPVLTNQKAKYTYSDGMLLEDIEGGKRLIKWLKDDSTGICIIPANIVDIHPQAFTDRYEIKEFKTDNNNNYAAKDGILYTKDMKKLVAHPAGYEIDTLEITEQITTVGAYAFYGNVFVKSITLPSSVETIGESAFGGEYSALKTLITGNEKIKLGINALSGKSLESYANLALNKEYVLENRVLFSADGTGLISYSKELEFTSYEVPKTVTWVADGAFRFNTSLSAITVAAGNTALIAENGVLYAKNDEGRPNVLYAYPREKADESFTVPESVLKISASAFYGNGNLKKITFGAEMKEFSPYMLAACGALEEINIKANEIIKLGAGSVKGCYAISKVVFGGSSSNWIKAVTNSDDDNKAVLGKLYEEGKVQVP